MDYLIFALIVIVWSVGLTSLWLVRKNITLQPPMTPKRAFSEAEIAAKAIGYWEKRGLAATDSEECRLCLEGLMKAQERLIRLTGNYVPEEAKKVFKKDVCDVLPPGVVSLASARTPGSER